MRHSPLAELTLRKYEKPIRLQGRDLVRKFCLSVGLLQPGDSRDVVVDVLISLLDAASPLSQGEIGLSTRASRTQAGSSMKGCAASNIRRQVRRLKESFLLDKQGSKYVLRQPLGDAFEEHFEKLYVPAIVGRVKEYCVALDKVRCGDETGSKK